MTKYTPSKPRHTLTFAGKDYELVGTFEVIEAVESALKDDIVRIASRVMDLPVTDTARLISAVTGSMSPREAGKIISEKYGASGKEYAGLKLSLYAFIRIIVAPPAEREGVAKEMGEQIDRWNQGSPGASTGASA